MRFGLLYLNEIKYDDLAWVFVKNSMDAEIIDTGVSVDSIDEEDSQSIYDKLCENGIDVAITMDFSPAVSDACMKKGAKYVSWIYDAPQQALFNNQIKNDCNYIFSFDKEQVNDIERLGASHVFHFPLATNHFRNSGLVIEENDLKRYGCDISFVGNLYNDDYYLRVYEDASECLREEMNRVSDEIFGKWVGRSLRECLSDAALKELKEIRGTKSGSGALMEDGLFYSTKLFASHIAHKERCEIARRLSEYDFRLYTGSDASGLEGVDVRPYLSYDEELPKAYHLSKINLNISLHSITSGVPLRVFDIMGVGGFMLTNYQPEVEELFSIGKDIEVYSSIEELEDKVRYYVKNEDKRNRIALKGYHTVSEKYNYEVAFKKIMELAEITL